MTRTARKLRRQFNIFGIRFQRWLTRMMPAFLPAGLVPFHPNQAPEIARLATAQREEMNRLVALWVHLNREPGLP